MADETVYPQIMIVRPVPASIPVTSKFGNRILDGQLDFHPGVDFGAPVGTPVQAGDDGVISRAGWENPAIPTQGYGLRVVQTINRGGMDYPVWYGHLSEILVKVGDSVKKGQVIAKTGATGKCRSSTGGSGAHLHVTIKKDWADLCEPTFEVSPVV